MIGGQITPRPIYCITRDVHNDRSLAESVCEGRFTHSGITLDLGTDPDWLNAALPTDEEWRIEWSKFYYGLDLANAFCAEGDARFLRTWERLVGSWITKVPIGSDASDAAARRMQNWTYAWSLFASSPSFVGLADGRDAEILAGIADHAGYVRGRLTPEVFRNHRTLELYALFVAALAFPTIDPHSELLRFTVAELHRTLMEGFGSDGVHRENSPHYHLVVLRSLLGARENARRFALELPDGFDDLLERACEFALHCHRPDGVVSPLSDADAAGYPEVLALAGALLDRPDFTYAATAGARGEPPQNRYVCFPAAGYFAQRSGWGAGRDSYSDERFLLFDCGPVGEGGHGHYDMLSVEIYARGRPLVVDPGRFTYSEEGSNLRHWFKGTAAHNTVCVDGRDQTPYRKGRPGRRVATATFMGRSSAPGIDILEGRAESPCYDAVHTRRVVLVGDEYWLVEDRLTSEHPHRYDLRWHLSPEAWGATEILRGGEGPVVRAPGVAFAFTHGAVDVEPGWVSPRYGVKQHAPVLNVSAVGSDVRFLTLVVPLTSDRTAPRLRERTGGRNSEATIVDIEGVGAEALDHDVVAWAPRPVPLVLGALRCRARAAWLRETASARARSFLGLEVSGFATNDDLELGPIGVDGCAGWDFRVPVAGGGRQR